MTHLWTPWRCRLVVWLPLIACLAAEALVLRVGVDDLDEGYFVQQAVRVLHGQLPYRDFQTLYTPGLLYLHATLFKLVGGPYLIAPRVAALAARAGLAALMVLLAQPLTRRPVLASLPAVLLLVGLDDAPVRWEPHPGWLSALFALLAAWCLTRSPTRKWLAASGAAAGMAYLFKQNTGVFILAAILARGAFARHHRAAQIGVPLAAFVVLTASWLLPLLIAINGQAELLGAIVGDLNQASLLSAPEIQLAIPLAALVGGVWLARHKSEIQLRWYLLAGGALFLTEYPRMDALHLAWSAPLLLVVGAVCLDRLPAKTLPPVLVALLLLVLPTMSSRVQAVLAPKTAITDTTPFADGLLVPEVTAADLHDLVRDIRQRTQPGEPVFVYPTSPLLYVLAERPNPTQFDHLNPGAADAGQIQQVIADLSNANVRLVVISEFWVAAWGAPGPNAPLVDWIDARYTQVAQFHAYRVLQDTSIIAR